MGISTALALSPSRALMIPGEEMAWDVYWQGLLVGHADLTVAASEVRTRFQTTALARTFAKVRYELVTTFAPGPARAPTSAREHVVYGGETTDITARLDGSAIALDAGPARGVPGGASLHTLHSALGALRAWSRDGANGGAPSAFAWIEAHGALYRLDVTRPGKGEALGHRALEIHGTLRPLDGATEPLELTVWLAATPDRTPLRVVVVSGDDRVAAELTETTATLSAR